MKGDLKKEGTYELFRTTKGHDMLNLHNKGYYALVEGQKGDLIIHSDADHEKQKTIAEGKYYFADFDDDPEFRDMAHLFLKDGSKFRELLLPEGFPTDKDHQRKLIRTEKKLPEKKVMDHIRGKGNKGSEKQYSGKKEGLRKKSKSELYEMAQKRKVQGRSRMDKKKLIEELRKND